MGMEVFVLNHQRHIAVVFIGKQVPDILGQNVSVLNLSHRQFWTQTMTVTHDELGISPRHRNPHSESVNKVLTLRSHHVIVPCDSNTQSESVKQKALQFGLFSKIQHDAAVEIFRTIES